MAAIGRHLGWRVVRKRGRSWKIYLHASAQLNTFSHKHCKTEANLVYGTLDEYGLPCTECF